MTRRRRLRPEELDLWKAVARSATPMHAVRPARAEKSKVDTPENHKEPAPEIPRFRIGQKAQTATPSHAFAPSVKASLAANPLAMDKKAFARMKRGKLKPDVRIDLHGMTLDQAHPALIGFIQRAHLADKRLVLVITGKGKQSADDGPIPQRMGVLRHQVPQWLRMPPLSHAVLQVTPAHNRHGGGGAYYVYLKKKR